MKATGALKGIFAFSFFASAPAWADSVTIPNTFVAGTPAVAADVNANFAAVKSAVDDNDARITANANAVATKADADDVAANTAAIATNTADIADNTADIATNVANIATNTADIADNTADIATNAANIATNTTNIATNSAAITNLQQNGSLVGTQCSGNDEDDVMVRVGPLCVDKYEASVWDRVDGTDGAGGAGTQYGTGSDNYPCTDNGDDCTGGTAIYARSEVGTIPSSYITWFQAQQACAASGKRLLTNAEWQMAVAGTPDPGAAGNDPVNECNTAHATSDKVNTGTSIGGNNQCLSNWGVADMVGNVHEWVADWIQSTGASSGGGGTNSATYGSDSAAHVQEAAFQGSGNNFPAAISRGGDFNSGTLGGAFAFNAAYAPSFSDETVGFRCAR